MTLQPPPPAPTPAHHTIASSARYRDAQAIVDRLADSGFAVDHVTIVGSDLQTVEHVTGRLDAARALTMGIVGGAFLGVVFGVIFGAWFTHGGTSYIGVVIYWLVVGAIAGAVWGLVGYALSGKRGFTSQSDLRASRYDVVVDEPYATEALRVLGTASTRTPGVTTPGTMPPPPPPGR